LDKLKTLVTGKFVVLIVAGFIIYKVGKSRGWL